ncbi:hypothetical protein BB560_003399 [Smittium megazygosporum]|uniref:Uncharacterized protein n=1 Tax=Smittium megazygosporum TaxID=133381 RepID=A0A2T9Z9B2_9FUNG|nr:hypothetical protein BB560_004478 [Smittium megazygosporum]PVV02157.1 hypothetical protein BB560_003399 [Smittium megazygosporum]
MEFKSNAEKLAIALKSFNSENYDESLQLFKKMMPSSKIYLNIGIIYLHINELGTANEWFSASIKLDNFFALAYFLKGVCESISGKYVKAINEYKSATNMLRGNPFIDYSQLGLPFTLRLAEIYYNMAVCYLYMDDQLSANACFESALELMNRRVNDWIKVAREKKSNEYNIFSLPKHIIFVPPASTFTSQEKLDIIFNKSPRVYNENQQIITDFKNNTKEKAKLRPISSISKFCRKLQIEKETEAIKNNYNTKKSVDTILSNQYLGLNVSNILNISNEEIKNSQGISFFDSSSDLLSENKDKVFEISEFGLIYVCVDSSGVFLLKRKLGRKDSNETIATDSSDSNNFNQIGFKRSYFKFNTLDLKSAYKPRRNLNLNELKNAKSQYLNEYQPFNESKNKFMVIKLSHKTNKYNLEVNEDITYNDLIKHIFNVVLEFSPYFQEYDSAKSETGLLKNGSIMENFYGQKKLRDSFKDKNSVLLFLKHESGLLTPIRNSSELKQAIKMFTLELGRRGMDENERRDNHLSLEEGLNFEYTIKRSIEMLLYADML